PAGRDDHRGPVRRAGRRHDPHHRPDHRIRPRELGVLDMTATASPQPAPAPGSPPLEPTGPGPRDEGTGPQAIGGPRPSGVQGCPLGDAVSPGASRAKAAATESREPQASGGSRGSPPWASTTAKAAVLIEALPWLDRFHGKTVVIKYGGHAMTDAALRAAIAQDVGVLRDAGLQPVLGHGGGPPISAPPAPPWPDQPLPPRLPGTPPENT